MVSTGNFGLVVSYKEKKIPIIYIVSHRRNPADMRIVVFRLILTER